MSFFACQPTRRDPLVLFQRPSKHTPRATDPKEKISADTPELNCVVGHLGIGPGERGGGLLVLLVIRTQVQPNVENRKFWSWGQTKNLH